jgi:hypothetical protein
MCVQRGLEGQALGLTFSPDWGCLRAVLRWYHPGAEYGCTDCWKRRRDWKQPGLPPAPMRKLKDYDTPLHEFLLLFDSELDVVYDVAHCCALVVTHNVCHALYWWCVDMEGVRPDLLPRLLGVYARHMTAHPFHPSAQKAVGRKEWSCSNNTAKELLFSDKFWFDLAEILPTSREGLEVSSSLLGPDPVADPLQEFLREVRRLCVQPLSWWPVGANTRNADAERVHALYVALKFPIERWTVQSHYWACHYQSRLLRHGNLVGMDSEGGEHLHQPHNRVVDLRPSFPRGKCPIGIAASVKWSALGVVLWEQKRRFPRLQFNYDVKLPSVGCI